MSSTTKRLLFAVWLLFIGGFALLHTLHLSADFPNHTEWFPDWAKYTDEGWYGNAAVRSHLFGNWYVRGDFNPAPAVPVWPFLEWILFSFSGVSLAAARSLSISFFFLNLLLSYLLLRTRGSRWMAMLALTLLVTSPFLYAFSRLAILEPMLTSFTLTALNLAVRLPKMKKPLLASAFSGVLFTLMLFTKTTAVFLLPMLAWAIVVPMWSNRRLWLRCCAAAAVTAGVLSAGWMGLVIKLGLLADYRYLFFINKYVKPPEFYWPAWAFWWTFHGTMWIDHILVPVTGAILLVAAISFAKKQPWGRALLLDPVFGISFWAIAGYILFMTYQNHPQPRYYAFACFFFFFIIALGTESLLKQTGWMRQLGRVALVFTLVAVCVNVRTTLKFVLHPEYTFVSAAHQITKYIDEHPNGNRLLLSISGDQITMETHLPSLCDDFGNEDLVTKLGRYNPGWWATWNDIDRGTLEDLHSRYSLEQVAKFKTFDDPERNVLVLFKLHPLAKGQMREPHGDSLQRVLPGDKIRIPIE